MSSGGPTDPDGQTGKLCTWIEGMKLESIPEEVKTRAKYLILDGIGCGLVGAHLDWSETAANSIFDFEGAGRCTVWGWERVRIGRCKSITIEN
jgi:aconitate decarboxylase